MESVLSLELRMFIFYKTNQLIAQYFAHWQDAEFTPNDIDERVKVFLPRVIQNEDRHQFSLLMMEYIAPLRNAHTSYWDMVMIRNAKGLGIELYYSQEKWIVKKSAIEQIVPGDVIISIDGLSTEQWFLRVCRYLCMQNEIAKRTVFPMYLPFLLSENETKIEWQNSLDKQCPWSSIGLRQ